MPASPAMLRDLPQQLGCVDRLAQGAAGAMWGKEKALEMLAGAGFRRVRVESLAHDLMNYWCVATADGD